MIDPWVERRERARTNLLRANTKVHRYMYELEYARNYIEGLMDYLVKCKTTKKQEAGIYNEILEWHKLIRRYEKYVENVV